jgi:hypothetical protein
MTEKEMKDHDAFILTDKQELSYKGKQLQLECSNENISYLKVFVSGTRDNTIEISTYITRSFLIAKDIIEITPETVPVPFDLNGDVLRIGIPAGETHITLFNQLPGYPFGRTDSVELIRSKYIILLKIPADVEIITDIPFIGINN